MDVLAYKRRFYAIRLEVIEKGLGDLSCRRQVGRKCLERPKPTSGACENGEEPDIPTTIRIIRKVLLIEPRQSPRNRPLSVRKFIAATSSFALLRPTGGMVTM